MERSVAGSPLLFPVTVSISATAQAGKRETESTTRRLQAHQTTTDSSRTPSRPIRSREINPPKQTDWLSRGGSECRNCAITDGIGDSSNLCPVVSGRTNPQAVILHIRSEKAKLSDFQQAAAGMHRSRPPRREGHRHGDR